MTGEMFRGNLPPTMKNLSVLTALLFSTIPSCGATFPFFAAMRGPRYDTVCDQDISPGFFYEDGVDNGSFTVSQSRFHNVQVGLRPKLKFNDAGEAENTFNSLGEGKYVFHAGIAPMQSDPVAEWWSGRSHRSHQRVAPKSPARELPAG